MTSVEQLAGMRTLLDEATASFWTDAECYAALANAQNEVIDMFLAKYKANGGELPYELVTILTSTAANISAALINIPTGFIWLVTATWNYNGSTGNKNCTIVSEDRDFRFTEDNVYTVTGGATPKVWVTDSSGTKKIAFLPTNSGTATYAIWYLKTPADIASGQNPVLPESTHMAMVFWATARMLEKDQRIQEAQAMQKRFAEAL